MSAPRRGVVPPPPPHLHAVRVFWLVWFLASFGVFLVVEVWGLRTDPRYTLSETIWWLEGWKPGLRDFANPLRWTAGHVLVGGVLGLVLLWLVGHFLFRYAH